MTATRILLHAGQPKTGSTTLQETLALSRPALEQSGITVWDVSVNHSGPIDELVQALVPGHAGTRTRAKSPLSGPAVVDHLTNALRASTSTFVVSAEFLWNLDVVQLAALRDLCLQAAPGARVEAVVYVRRPGRHVASFVQQKLKAGMTFDETMRRFPVLEYRRLADFDEVFGREAVDVRLMPELGDSARDLVRDFATVLGVPDMSWPDVDPRNRSFSHSAAHLVNAMHAARPADVPFTGRHRWLTRQVRDLIGGERYRLPPELVDDVIARYSDDFAWLRESRDIDLLDPPPDRTPVESPQAPSFAEVAALLQSVAQGPRRAG